MTARVFVYIVYAIIATGLIYVIGTPFFEPKAKESAQYLDKIERHPGRDG
jgi:hypothetical protein